MIDTHPARHAPSHCSFPPSRHARPRCGWGLASRCLIASVVLGSPALAMASDFAPGAAGLGDPYFPLDGNGGYDAEHYRLRLRYDPGSGRLDGVASIQARATQSLSQFNFDLDGLQVLGAEVDGCAAGWSQADGELTITPERGLREGVSFEVTIRYGGVPQPLIEPDGSSSGFFPRTGGAVVIGEPHGASSWFPANDHPTERASFRFEISVPEGVAVAANGVLSSHDTRDGWTTWVWDAREAMASYLAGMVIGDLAVRAYHHDGIRYWDAIDSDLFLPSDDELPAGSLAATPGDAIAAALDRQPEIIAFLEDQLGPYPFDVAGASVASTGADYSLEAQTRPIYPASAVLDGGAATLVHELTHQWFGDSLTLGAWQDIWLNEGFATYTGWLWSEREGTQTAQQTFDAVYGSIDADDPYWQLLVGDPGPAHLFDAQIFDRGAMTLHALRLTVGDDAFFDILQTWAAAYAGQAVSTDDFIALSEALSGHELGGVFDAWLFTPTKPAIPAPQAAALP